MTINKDEAIRGLALQWWRGLTIRERKELATTHKPGWTFEMVDSSTMTIVQIYEAKNEK